MRRSGCRMRLVHAVATITCVLIILILLMGGCVVLSPAGRSLVEHTWFRWRMSRFVSEFDRLNAEVFSQLPVYPDAQLARLSSSGADADDPLVSTPRHLNAFYISDDPPAQIYEFLKSEMLAQGWQEERHGLTALYRRGHTCVGVRVRDWDTNSESVTGYELSLPDKIPTSWYWLYIEHAIEAVPSAPSPPDWSLFECRPEGEQH